MKTKPLLNALIFAAGLLACALSQALTILPYEAAAVAKAQAAGEPLALHFHASWCPTCRAQSKTLEALKAEPNLDLTVWVVDFDKEVELKKQLKVRSQSTLIVYRGSKETSRQIGSSAPDDMRATLRSAF
ncbi:thioredoxin [Paucibacter sp. KBW04]|uniref:thioredoxin family protein n=1 Tax=Paucibacter sp. KBW04 TaxID=2153361 RepID=UPI000F5831FB|nr:thioredoxin family protein [Paucibacter sp. KBW04]RQO59938.1 thioredoxin [Paucibacter sp. KBW04]